MTSFTPAAQDAAATTLLSNLGAIKDAMEGNFAQAMKDAGNRWASLPGSRFHQGHATIDEAKGIYDSAIANCK
jgi:muramidase (phage lysozyme)